MDLETRTINGVMSVISISYFDGKQCKSYFVTDFKNSDDMFISVIKSVMIRKYNGYKIYLHNLSNFDGIFLLRTLSKLNGKIKPIIRDNIIIQLKLTFNLESSKRKYNICFRDSLLMLPSS